MSGQVARVLVDDNDRVKKGDVLVRLDKEPFEVQVALKRAAVQSAEANLTAAEAQARGLEAQAVSQRWKLQLASEQVNAQIAQLRALAAALKTRQATLDEAQSEYERARRLLASSAVSREDFDQHEQQFRVADAAVSQAREDVYQVRAALGLPPQPEEGKDLTDVPPDLDQTASAVRTALGELAQTMTQLG